MAVPFDPQRLTVTGAAVPVVEGVLQSTITGAAQYSFSATGSLVYVPGGVQAAQRRLVWVSRNGAEQPLAAPAHAYAVSAAFPRRSAGSRGDRGTGDSNLAVRSFPGDVDPVYVSREISNLYAGLDAGWQADSVSIQTRKGR